LKKNTIVLISAIAILTVSILAIFLYSKYQEKVNNELEWNKTIFSISEFGYYSSGNGISNDTGKEAKWDLNLYQYTNIAFKVNNQNDYTGRKNKNTIKELKVENFSVLKTPKIGDISFYYKNPNDLTFASVKPDNLINNELNYSIIDFEVNLDYDLPQINRNGGYVSLQIVNNNIKNNFVIEDVSNALTYDGTLIQKAEIPLENLDYQISFDIIVTNELDEKYKCNVVLDAPIKSEISEDTIYTLGNISSYNSNSNIYKFERIK